MATLRMVSMHPILPNTYSRRDCLPNVNVK